MRVKGQPLFKNGPVEAKRDQAVRAIDAVVSRLAAGRLEDPSLAARLAEHFLPQPPRLGDGVRYWTFETCLTDPEADPKQARAWAIGVEVIVPFRGSRDFFGLRAGAQPLETPRAVIRPRSLVLTTMSHERDATELVRDMDDVLTVISRELEEQRERCQSMLDDLEQAARRSIEARQIRLRVLAEVSGVLATRGWTESRSPG